MKIKISKAQWEHIGKQAGWIKTANISQLQHRYPKNPRITLLKPHANEVVNSTLDELINSYGKVSLSEIYNKLDSLFAKPWADHFYKYYFLSQRNT